jgi:hypothetical protein
VNLDFVDASERKPPVDVALNSEFHKQEILITH